MIHYAKMLEEGDGVEINHQEAERYITISQEID